MKLRGSNAPQPPPQQMDWRDCFIRAVSEMPADWASVLVKAMPADMVSEILKSKDDPFYRFALLLLQRAK